MRLRVLPALAAFVGVLLSAGAVRAQPTPSTASVRADTGRAPLPATARAAVLGPLAPAPVPALPRARPQTNLSLLEAAPSYHPQRFWYGVGTAVALDAGVTAALASIWYDEAERTGFHFYSESENIAGSAADDGWLDDWHTFVQQDKLGHVWTSWHITRIVGGYGRWAGLSPSESALFGGIVSTVFQTQIEVSDSFSKAYGFSRTDALANLVGSAAGGLQVTYPERMDWFAAKYPRQRRQGLRRGHLLAHGAPRRTARRPRAPRLARLAGLLGRLRRRQPCARHFGPRLRQRARGRKQRAPPRVLHWAGHRPAALARSAAAVPGGAALFRVRAPAGPGPATGPRGALALGVLLSRERLAKDLELPAVRLPSSPKPDGLEV
ncbi:MAG: hypothetical protein BRD37_03545 [Bacteroidetes bacterium QH_8_67_23]|nr:MAG: hypothetical protein BRD37_03545 [Bacteroidetes bacterium QH_8_67_23]